MASALIHFKQRTLATCVILVLFVLHSVLFIDSNQKSCLGNPSLLPFAFIGLPLIMILLVIDIIILAIMKKLNWYKVLINMSIGTIVFLGLVLISQ